MIKKLLAATFIIATLTTSSALAVPDYKAAELGTEKAQRNDRFYRRVDKDMREEFEKDPLKALEKKKAEILALRKEGKISQEKAQAIIDKIDALSERIKEFNKLPLDKKKAVLIQGCKTKLDALVKDGRMTQAKADGIMKDFTAKIYSWDGTGYPSFHSRSHSHMHKNVD
ncbi:MAG: hypothetical protein N2376_05330 [Clostridia bacterium]|nr:hypothetical protein [Clostridia bacterium]